MAGGQVPGNAEIPTEAVDGESVQDSVTQAPQTKVQVKVDSSTTSGGVVTNFELSGTDVSAATTEAAVPRLDGLLVRSAFQKLKSVGEEIQAGIEEAVARQLEADAASTAQASQAVASEAAKAEPSPSKAEASVGEVITSQTTEAVGATPSSEGAFAPKSPVSEPAGLQTVPAPNATQQATPAAPGFSGMLGNASPEEIAALMGYLQQLQAQKTEGSTKAPAPQPAAPKVSTPKSVPQPAVPESSAPESPSAEAVASMTAPVEPSGQEPETKQVGKTTSSKQALSDLKSSENDALETPDSLTKADYDAMLDFLAPGSEQAKGTPSPRKLSATKSTGGPVAGSEKSTDDIYNLDALKDEKPADQNHALESALDEELASKLQKAMASEGIASESKPLSEAREDGEKEPSRLPRNVQAYYLQPLRRVAEYGVPSCDLQLRSYSLRPLESFCDFALRAAYYLGLPAYGPVPLPKIIERWTVPKSTFIYKKAQENFERITRRRLIQIKDGHPETVQIWLAFLQKHQQAAVGMKANMWEFSSIGKSLCRVFLFCTEILTLWIRCCQGDEQSA